MYLLNVPGDTYMNSPVWWQNFIDHFNDSVQNMDGDEVAYDNELYKALIEYHASMLIKNVSPDRYNTEITDLIFPDEKYATAFILKWA